MSECQRDNPAARSANHLIASRGTGFSLSGLE